MSYLREIMQRLAEGNGRRPIDRSNMQTDERELVKLHVDTYQTKLEHCSKAMLQYEWAWWKEHIDALELCLSQPDMCDQIGGYGHVQKLLAESRECQRVLVDAMKAAMVNPAGHGHSIHPSEHAWEVSLNSVRDEWGFS